MRAKAIQTDSVLPVLVRIQVRQLLEYLQPYCNQLEATAYSIFGANFEMNYADWAAYRICEH
jgi:hypothetical protein